MKYLLFLIYFSLITSAHAGECDFIKFNTCRSCDDRFAFSVGSDETCAFLCPNREINYEGSGTQAIRRNCALKKCPPEFPFSSEDGSCFATKEEAKAENDYEPGVNNEGILTRTYATAPLAINGKCPENLPIKASGKCFSCDENNNFSISEEECDKCPNRIYKKYPKWEVEQCESRAPADKPLQRWDGKFFPCDERAAVRVATHCNIEEDCEELCPNRTILYWVGGNVPSVPNCPPDKPMMDSEGICFACDTPIDIGVDNNTRLCKKFCPNERHLKAYLCVLN